MEPLKTGMIILDRSDSFISVGIRTAEYEKENGFGLASHVSMVVESTHLPIKDYKELKKKWDKKGYDINPDTIWKAESTFPKKRLAPYLIDLDVDTLIVDWKNIEDLEREALAARALKRLKHWTSILPVNYPVLHYGVYMFSLFVKKSSVKLLRLSPLGVCSKFVGKIVHSSPLMRKKYGDGSKKNLIFIDGVDIRDTTPDNFCDEALKENSTKFRIVFYTSDFQ